MKNLKISFLILMLMASVPVFADYAPANVQAALKKLYPAASEVAWSRDYEYYVADFMMNGFDTKVWFGADGKWAMKQTDWETMDQVPAAVFNTFSMSQYAGGEVQNVTFVQFPEWQSMVAIEIGMSNIQTKYQLLFTVNGDLIRARNVTYMYNILGATTFL